MGDKGANSRQMTSRDRKRAADFVARAYNKHARDLERFFQKRLRRRGPDVLELCQEVWKRLLKAKLPDQVAEPLAYIHRTANNVYNDYVHDRNRCCVDYGTAALDSKEAVEPLVDDLVDVMCSEERLGEAFDDLPELYAQIVVARHVDGETFAEIADRLKITELTARQYHARAMRLLKERLSVSRAGGTSASQRRDRPRR